MAINKNIQIIISAVIIIVLSTGGIVLNWEFDKDWITLKRDGVIIAKEKWIVQAERTYFNLDSWYDTNVKCPKVIDQGGHITATRCYYPDEYYEQLSRSLINTKINNITNNDSIIITKESPNYAYGTRGAYAGILTETMEFRETDKIVEFPYNYNVSWIPRDTRNYRLIWRIDNLKEINIPEGVYYNCYYRFGKIKIDFKQECDKFEKAIIKDDQIDIYFLPERGDQFFIIKLVDPGITVTLNRPLNNTEQPNLVDFNFTAVVE